MIGPTNQIDRQTEITTLYIKITYKYILLKIVFTEFTSRTRERQPRPSSTCPSTEPRSISRTSSLRRRLSPSEGTLIVFVCGVAEDYVKNKMVDPHPSTLISQKQKILENLVYLPAHGNCVILEVSNRIIIIKYNLHS